MGNLSFATEEDRVTAINELGDDPKNLSKLEEIRGAEIGTLSAQPDNTPPAGEVPPEAPPAPEIPAPPAAPAEPPEPQATKWEITKEELPEGYKSPKDVLKAFGELRSTFERQTKFIKEKLGETPPSSPSENEALRRAEAAEQELAKLRGTAPAATPAQTSADIGAVQTEIQRIEALQAELEKQADEDPDSAFTAEFQKKSRELSRLQTKNLNALTALYNQARQEIVETKSTTSEMVASRKQQEESEAVKNVLNSRYKEMTELDIPELKLSKSAKDVENEYVQWREDVSLAYYGRPAKTREEKMTALQQLQLKNPELLSKCQIFGVKPEATPDVQRYIQQCEMIDYQEGWRKDPATGEWTQLLKMDPKTGKQVPYTYPTLKAAIQAKRLEEGYYEKQRDGAFQKGAQSLAQAALRRDQGAVELDLRGDAGQGQQNAEWAIRVLTETDEEKAMIEYRKGNRTKFDAINAAKKALGQDPITFN
jgi:hypothetical protein